MTKFDFEQAFEILEIDLDQLTNVSFVAQTYENNTFFCAWSAALLELMEVGDFSCS